MEYPLPISFINDFLFCPRSIYFHRLYQNYTEEVYHDLPQAKGLGAHKAIDSGSYSTSKGILMGMDIFSEEYGIVGKIDLFDQEKKALVERKRRVKAVYDGFKYQLYAQTFCLLEMGYEVESIALYSIADNKKYPIDLPAESDKSDFKKLTAEIKSCSLLDKTDPNPAKCSRCIYRPLCDAAE